jgi:hypothetical protein
MTGKERRPSLLTRRQSTPSFRFGQETPRRVLCCRADTEDCMQEHFGIPDDLETSSRVWYDARAVRLVRSID